jgi:hypothetical protein
MTLADEAERSGFAIVAEHLSYLAITIVDNPASLRA